MWDSYIRHFMYPYFLVAGCSKRPAHITLRRPDNLIWGVKDQIDNSVTSAVSLESVKDMFSLQQL